MAAKKKTPTLTNSAEAKREAAFKDYQRRAQQQQQAQEEERTEEMLMLALGGGELAMSIF